MLYPTGMSILPRFTEPLVKLGPELFDRQHVRPEAKPCAELLGQTRYLRRFQKRLGEHLRITEHDPRRSIHQDAPSSQHDRAIRKLSDDVHVVSDDDDRSALL